MTDLHQSRISIARRKTSGASTIQALPEPRLAAIEQALIHFHEVAADRDALRTELAALKQTHVEDQVQISAMTSLINTLESRAASYQSERDLAVAQRSVYEALFVGIQAQLRAFEPPTAPLAKQLTAEQKMPDTASAQTAED